MDTFTEKSGTNFWSRPIDTSLVPIQIYIMKPNAGSSGTARLVEYGIGEPTITPNNPPGTIEGSRSNPDPFLHTDPYEEPIYETRLMCEGGHFEWVNDGCTLNPVPIEVKSRVSSAVGLMVVMHYDASPYLSSCTGTLVGPDLFLTSRHCLTDRNGRDVRSASVTFEYATQCNGRKRAFHTGRFFKVLKEVAAGAPANGTYPPVSSDWVLLRLDSTAGGLPAPVQIRDTDLMYGETIFTAHHPNGAVKKFQSGVHDGGDINGFSFAGGSSGSALFDIEGKLVMGPLSRPIILPCSVSYTPLSPIRNWLSNPTPTLPPVPIDLIIVIDGSLSMTSLVPPIGRTNLEEAKDAASLFVQLVEEGHRDRLGLVTFNTFVTINTFPDSVEVVKPVLTGPTPFTTGKIGSINASGATCVESGLVAAMSSLGSDSAHERVVLLLTDGLQNISPLTKTMKGSLGFTRLYVVGFGSDADADGSFLTRIGVEHNGQFMRAVDGLTLRKIIGVCVANIFESGALSSPEFALKVNQIVSDPHSFSISGEEQFTVVLGWDDPMTSLKAGITTPKGTALEEKNVVVRGKTWAFWRVSLPYAGEKDGTWHFTVERSYTMEEFASRKGDVRYFFLIVFSGGPKLTYLGGQRHVYTGDDVDALLGCHYDNGTTSEAEVEVTVDCPIVGLGKFVTDTGLRPPSISGDAVGAFRATLQAVVNKDQGLFSIPASTLKFRLFDDGSHQDGAMEPDGIYNQRIKELTQIEGTYQFRALARYGTSLSSSREAFWSIHVEPGIDQDHSSVTLMEVKCTPDGNHGMLVIFPRDRYDNPLGPGRAEAFTISPMQGVKSVGPVEDQRDGSYKISAVWDVSTTSEPRVLLHQPGRDPVVLTPKNKPGA
jgi:hypothetical protein